VAILVGGGFFGVKGMFFGVPVFAAIRTLIKYIVDRRLAGRGMTLEAAAHVKRDLRQPPADAPEKEKEE
jgi:predicted PurR-regulated permease PerM